MKEIVVTFSFICICLFSNAQESNQLNKMIIESLRSYMSYNSELRKKECADCEKYNTYICRDGLPSNFPYDSLPNVTFFSVDFFRVYSNHLKKQLQKGIDVLFVSFKLKNNQLQVSITSKSVKLMNKKAIVVGLSNWCNCFYEYSCEKQEWELKENKFGGI
ncbi:MAG: hypothetical protein SPF56_08950 [Bacteroidaceae bacterium]|nr:hypothetical protein [Prevotellaceae bacterium]MDY5632599.1 hypothetical protein [Bacteroidaceae bacterium]